MTDLGATEEANDNPYNYDIGWIQKAENVVNILTNLQFECWTGNFFGLWIVVLRRFRNASLKIGLTGWISNQKV